MREYLLPANVVTRFEFFQSFGWLELSITLVGIALGGAFFLGLRFVHAPIAVRLVIGVMCSATAYLSTRKIDGTFSLLNYLFLWWRWARRPREYWLW